MTLRGAKPPIGPYAPRVFGVQNAAGIMADCGRNQKGSNGMGDVWALRDSNPGASDYESVSNVETDGQGADSGSISGPLRTGADTGIHPVESVYPQKSQHPKKRPLACGTNAKYASYAHRCRSALCREAHRLAAWKYRGSTIRRRGAP